MFLDKSAGPTTYYFFAILQNLFRFIMEILARYKKAMNKVTKMCAAFETATEKPDAQRQDSWQWNGSGFTWFLQSFLGDLIDRDLKAVSIQIPPRSALDSATADPEDVIHRDDDDDDDVGEAIDGDISDSVEDEYAAYFAAEVLDFSTRKLKAHVESHSIFSFVWNRGSGDKEKANSCLCNAIFVRKTGCTCREAGGSVMFKPSCLALAVPKVASKND